MNHANETKTLEITVKRKEENKGEELRICEIDDNVQKKSAESNDIFNGNFELCEYDTESEEIYNDKSETTDLERILIN